MIFTKQNAPRYIIMAEDIIKAIKIGQLQYGDYIPTEQDCAGKYGVSRKTVRNAFDMLEQQGFISPVKAKKRQVLKNFEKNHWIVGCLCRSARGSGTNEFAEIVDLHLFENMIYEFQKKNISLQKILVDHINPEYPDILFTDHFDLLIGAGNHNNFVLNILDRIKAPLIALSPDYDLQKKVDFSILPSGREVAIDAVNYLYARGHRNIGYLLVDTDYSFYDDIESGFRRGAINRGLAFKERVIRFSASRGTGEKSLESVLTGAVDVISRLDALLLCTPRIAPSTIAVLKKLGISVPEQLSLLSFAGDMAPEACTPQITIYENDHEKNARLISEYIIAILNGNITLPCKLYTDRFKLVERESVISR